MRKKRRKKGFGYYLYAAVALGLAIINLVIAVFLLTYVQGIRVQGNEYVTKKQVQSWIKEDSYTMNSIYAVVKYKVGAYELPPYLESVRLGWSKPWELSVQVEEKRIIGCVLSGGAYVYFAEDGTVMKKGEETIEGIPVIEGIQAAHFELYEMLEIKDEKTFSSICEIAQAISENELKPNRMVWENGSVNLYFEEIRVQLGRTGFQDKLIQLPPILEKLVGKKGTLHLEHYNDRSSGISFVEDKQ